MIIIISIMLTLNRLLCSINITKSGIKIENFLNKQDVVGKKDNAFFILNLFDNLERIYYKVSKDEKLEKELQNFYEEEDGFFDVRSLLKKGLSQGTLQNTKVEAIIKIPLLSKDRSRYNVDKISEDYETRGGINYEFEGI